MTTICLDKTIFTISFFTLIIVAIFFSYLNYSLYYHQINNINDQNKQNEQNNKTPISFFDILMNRDYKVLNDPLTPNERRVDRSQFPRSPLLQAINIPTRGYPDNYQYMGNLLRESDERVIKLMGRETYPSSLRYEYYGLTSDPNGTEYKVNIESKNEIQDGDIVKVSALGDFKAMINKYDTPRYNPFVFY